MTFIARAVAPIGVATGEQCQNRVIFKQLLQAGAIRFCQIDSCRLGGVNEVLAVLLLAAKFGVPVCPHAGGVGLCEYVQHLSIFDYVCVSASLEDRIDGVSAYEVFADALSDDVVLELDTYWVTVGGDDPVAIIGKYGDKVQFLHVKDGDGSHDDKKQVAVGDGVMPVREIVAAAPEALHVVELDDHEGDVFQAVADSYTFLQGVRA